MATHLGRLKIVTKRVDGSCRYKHCPIPDNKMLAGEKALILTRMGKLNGKPTIFYKSYHTECFGPWVIWMCDQTPASKDGRKTMELDPKVKEHRNKLVRERARILRSLRRATAGNLEFKAERIGELDRLIHATGYPIIKYKGRRSQAIVNLDKFIKEVKGQYGSEMRVPKSVFNKAKDMGVEREFREAMDKWRQDVHERVRSGTKHFEDKLEDKEEEPDGN